MLTLIQSQAASNHLLTAYYQSVHSTFPIFDKTTFFASQRAKSSHSKAAKLQCWHAALNLVFAIGAKFSALTHSGCEQPDGCLPDQVYFSIAWAACRDRLLLSGPSTECVQVAGLMSLYLLCVNQIERYYLVFHLTKGSC